MTTEKYVTGKWVQMSPGSLYRPSRTYVAPVTPGRNDPCSCGSGRKYKRCCGARS